MPAHHHGLSTSTQSVSSSLPIALVARLAAIFAANGWSASESQLFEQYCRLLKELTDEEQDLILLLTSRFLYCTLTYYDMAVRELVEYVVSTIPSQLSRIVVIPLADPSNAGRIKSPTTFAYLVLTKLRQITTASSFSIADYESPQLWAASCSPSRPGDFILLCDDFIGSGDSAMAAMKPFEDATRGQFTNTNVVALAAHRIGINRIKTAYPCVDVLAYHVRTRGISDSSDIDCIEKAKCIMTSIESRIGISDQFRFGYRASEGLESLIRTPNNTFPVFWAAGPKSERPWPAPFRR